MQIETITIEPKIVKIKFVHPPYVSTKDLSIEESTSNMNLIPNPLKFAAA
jgi:hypothetical protein